MENYLLDTGFFTCWSNFIDLNRVASNLLRNLRNSNAAKKPQNWAQYGDFD